MMAKEKKETTTIGLTPKHKAMANKQSMFVLGSENISAYFAYLLEKEERTLNLVK